MDRQSYGRALYEDAKRSGWQTIREELPTEVAMAIAYGIATFLVLWVGEEATLRESTITALLISVLALALFPIILFCLRLVAAPVRIYRQQRATIEHLQKFSRPFIEYKRFGIARPLEDDRLLLIFPHIALYNPATDDLQAALDLRLWEERRGAYGEFRLCPAFGHLPPWEDNRDTLVDPPFPSLGPQVAIKGRTATAGYAAFALDRDDAKLLFHCQGPTAEFVIAEIVLNFGSPLVIAQCLVPVVWTSPEATVQTTSQEPQS